MTVPSPLPKKLGMLLLLEVENVEKAGGVTKTSPEATVEVVVIEVTVEVVVIEVQVKAEDLVPDLATLVPRVDSRVELYATGI